MLSIQISSSSGRLQLTDATGSIDVVIPDLPSTWNFESMIEVNDYDIVLEGIPETVHTLQSSEKEAFSCQRIFQGIPATTELNAAIYVHFYVQKASCRKLFFSPCEDSVGNFKELESGTFHLLLVTHKFPALQKVNFVAIL
ncbi:hypothetical protein RJ641_029085 [Dillenia turbinata]|uniref:CST complex subunit CTC1 n=1 Tax=Dillenia turbinata TaxID=194707 RepID=A0AAN8ZFZ2_9MAGN